MWGRHGKFQKTYTWSKWPHRHCPLTTMPHTHMWKHRRLEATHIPSRQTIRQLLLKAIECSREKNSVFRHWGAQDDREQSPDPPETKPSIREAPPMKRKRMWSFRRQRSQYRTKSHMHLFSDRQVRFRESIQRIYTQNYAQGLFTQLYLVGFFFSVFI